jgi:hypothetical protein
MADDNTPAPDTAPDATPDTEPAPDVTPAPDEGGSSPWASDLATTFEDENVRGQVDEFLRAQVQPYVTKLEQDSTDNRYANRLWDDFTNNPLETYKQVSEELLGEDVAAEVLKTIENYGETPAPAPDQASTTPSSDQENQITPTQAQDQIPDRLRPVVEDFENRQLETNYNQAIERLQEDNPDVEIDKDLFHPFVAATQGDLDVALEGYKEWVSGAKQRFGVDVNADEIPPETPPQVIDQPASATPPQEQAYESLDEALDAFFDEQKRPPTPVGAT